MVTMTSTIAFVVLVVAAVVLVPGCGAAAASRRRLMLQAGTIDTSTTEPLRVQLAEARFATLSSGGP